MSLWRRLLVLVCFILPMSSFGPEAGPGGAVIQPGCDLVEIRPGYPGFRANLPGMLGPGDMACLSDLQALDPYFDRAEQDTQNWLAADRLGVVGAPTQWTWETWMAIAIERNLPLLCYACVATNGGLPLPSLPPDIDMLDPRVQLGRFGERSVAARFLAERGLSPSSIHNAPTDDQLRAIMGMANPGIYLTASQLLSGYEELLTLWYCLEGPPCQHLDFDRLYANLLDQGGYAPMPGEASEPDQFYQIAEGINALSLTLPPLIAQPMMNAAVTAYEDWKLAGPTRPSFAEWYRQRAPYGS